MTSPDQGVATGASTELAWLSAADMLEGFRSGAFSPLEVFRAVKQRLVDVQGLCNVMVTPMFEQAEAQAARATDAWHRGDPTGPLCGVPVTIKDLIYVHGVEAFAGNPRLHGFVPPADAAVVEALRRSGAVLTCKTTTCESGYKLTADSPVTGITRNPWRLERTSGGSSGGAAAAVAAGCGPLAVGTDGVGSIRVPSSFCGVFGIKPTFGLVPRSPGFSPPPWASLAHTGPIAREVRDAALLLEVLAFPDARDPASLALGTRRFDTVPGKLDGVRIACTDDFGSAPVAPSVRAAFAAAVRTLADLGAEMIGEGPRIDDDALTSILQPIAFTEQAAAAGSAAADLTGSDAEYRAVIAQGSAYSGIEYIRAGYRRAQLRARFVELFRSVDALVTPTVAVTAFAAGTLGVDRVDDRAVDRHLGWSPFSWPINLTGLPAATLPCGFDDDGLPIGLQIVAPWLDEPLVFRIAAAFEAAMRTSARRPALGTN